MAAKAQKTGLALRERINDEITDGVHAGRAEQLLALKADRPRTPDSHGTDKFTRTRTGTKNVGPKATKK